MTTKGKESDIDREGSNNLTGNTESGLALIALNLCPDLDTRYTTELDTKNTTELPKDFEDMADNKSESN